MLIIHSYRLKCNAPDYQGCEDSASNYLLVESENKSANDSFSLAYMFFAKIQKTIVSSEESFIFPLRKAKTNFVFVDTNVSCH